MSLLAISRLVDAHHQPLRLVVAVGKLGDWGRQPQLGVVFDLDRESGVAVGCPEWRGCAIKGLSLLINTGKRCTTRQDLSLKKKPDLGTTPQV